MKSAGKIYLILLLCMIFSVTVSADVQKGKTKPDYKTDYYMIVESKQGGIDIYSQPDFASVKLNEELIPNGTALHIEGEVEDKGDMRIWGYVIYHGMRGFIPLDDCRPAQSRKEAIDSELYIAGRDHVNYNADYDVKAYTQEGTQQLYQGPGEKYGIVPGLRDIENGEILHITQNAELVDGSNWGVTVVDGKEGWVNLDNTEESARERGIFSKNETSGEKTGEIKVTQAAESTVEAVKPSETVGNTAGETKITEIVENTNEEAKSAEAVENIAKDENTVDEYLEIESTEETAEKASSQEVTADAESHIPAPFLWIAAAAIVAISGVIIYHIKTR